MKLWTAEEYILDGTNGNLGKMNGYAIFSSKENAIDAVYELLRREEIEEKDIQEKIEQWTDFDILNLLTKYGEEYGLYDCRYEIYQIDLDAPIEL